MLLIRPARIRLPATGPRALLAARLTHGARRRPIASALYLAARSAALLAGAAGLGLGAGALGLGAYFASEPGPCAPDDVDVLVLRAYAALPWRAFSRAVGHLHDVPLPPWARAPLLGCYARLLGIELADARPAELAAYASAGELFARRLAPGARVVDRSAPLVSPVDGLVLSAGPVVESARPWLLVKGVAYRLGALLGGGSAHQGRPLHHVAIYLAPADYHGFHAPADAVLADTRHVAGSLLSVRPAVLARLPVLGANERLALSGVWAHGFLALVAVGATGVGSIELEHGPPVRSNAPGTLCGSVAVNELAPRGAAVKRGERLGGFRAGSSVVLVFESAAEPEYAVQPGQRVRLGEPLVSALRPQPPREEPRPPGARHVDPHEPPRWPRALPRGGGGGRPRDGV